MSLDWNSFEQTLFDAAKRHLATFLVAPEVQDIYGVGFFCDAVPPGCIRLVANTRSYHTKAFGEYAARFGTCNEDVFRWDTGNWKCPAGLFPSATANQQAFDDTLSPFLSVFAVESDEAQAELEQMCGRTLKRLYEDGVLLLAKQLEGLTVNGPYGDSETQLGKKRSFDYLLRR